MMQLYRLLPQWVDGTYNYKEIKPKEFDLMGQLEGEFTYVKSGRAPKLSPYAFNVVFCHNGVNTHICRPFFGVQSGYVVSSMLREVLEELELAPSVFFPIKVKVKGVAQTWYFCFFYSSLRHMVDLKKSSFLWVDPNRSTYDPNSGRITEHIIEKDMIIDENDLSTMGNMIGSKTLRCVKTILRSEVQVYDMFELDMFPNCLYVNERTKEVLTSAFEGLEILEDSTFIDTGD